MRVSQCIALLVPFLSLYTLNHVGGSPNRLRRSPRVDNSFDDLNYLPIDEPEDLLLVHLQNELIRTETSTRSLAVDYELRGLMTPNIWERLLRLTPNGQPCNQMAMIAGQLGDVLKFNTIELCAPDRIGLELALLAAQLQLEFAHMRSNSAAVSHYRAFGESFTQRFGNHGQRQRLKKTKNKVENYRIGNEFKRCFQSGLLNLDFCLHFSSVQELLQACQSKNHDSINRLLRRDFYIFSSTTYDVLRCFMEKDMQSYPYAKAMLNSGMIWDIDFNGDLFTPAGDVYLLLWEAIDLDFDELVRLMAKRIPPSIFQADMPINSINMAVIQGKFKYVRMLLEVLDEEHPLIHDFLKAVSGNRHGVEVIKVLREFGADINHIFSNYWTPLSFYSAFQDPHLINYMLDEGAKTRLSLLGSDQEVIPFECWGASKISVTNEKTSLAQYYHPMATFKRLAYETFGQEYFKWTEDGGFLAIGDEYSLSLQVTDNELYLRKCRTDDTILDSYSLGPLLDELTIVLRPDAQLILKKPRNLYFMSTKDARFIQMNARAVTASKFVKEKVSESSLD